MTCNWAEYLNQSMRVKERVEGLRNNFKIIQETRFITPHYHEVFSVDPNQ